MNLESKTEWLGRCLKWLGFACLLYLLPPILVLLDEEVFKTRWIGNHIPRAFGDLFCTIYPWLCAMFGG